MPAHTVRIAYTRPLTTAAGECTTYDNVVTIDQTGQTAAAEAELCAPGITKTVDADYGRKQLWQLTKTVEEDPRVEIAEGGEATFTYTVTATPTQLVDDGTASWTGTVTVSNPSTTRSLTVDVTDVPDVAGWESCAFDEDATGRTIAAGGELDLTYTCTGEGHAEGGTNTATASFDGGSVSTPAVPVRFDARTGVADSEVTVTDDMTDPDGEPLTFTAKASDRTTWSATYTLRKSGVGGQCTPYTNKAEIAPTKSAAQEASTTVTVCVEKPLVVSKTAAGTFARDYSWDIAKAADEPRAQVPETETPFTFDYDVTAKPLGYEDSGWEVTGVITVTNPNGYPEGAISATVGDRLSGITGTDCTVTGPEVELAPGATEDLPYRCTLAPTGEDYTGTNVATATWSPAPTYLPERAGTPNPASTSASSDAVPVTLTLPEANVTDFAVDVYDDPQGPSGPTLLGTAEWGEEPGTDTPGPDTVFGVSVDRDGVAGECRTYDNLAWVDEAGASPTEPGPGDGTATETVELCVAEDLTVSKSVGLAYERLYNWSLAKSGPGTVFVGDDSTGSATYDITVTAEEPTDSGVTVTGTITVTNPNSFQDVVVDVGDTFTLDGVDTACAVTGGPEGDGQDVVVPAGASIPLGYTCDLADGTWPEDYRGSNEVTVTWDRAAYTTPTGEASSTNAVDPPEVSETPAFRTIVLEDEIARAGGDPAQVTLPEQYRTLTWEEGLEVTFPVTVTLEPGLEPGACTTYTNVVSIADSTVGPGTATTEVCRPAVAKDEDARFGRTYKWTITKVADETEAEVGPGGRPTFTYTVRVAPDGSTDSAPTWKGTISVTNPSTSSPLTVDLTDLPNQQEWSCAVDGEATLEVAPGDTARVGYTCTPGAGATREGVENTARASFGDGERVQATIPVTFTEVPTDDTITVTDPKAPGDGVLGTATWSEGARTFTYPWTAPESVAGTCQPYDNTATITETGQFATEQVEVCVEAPLTATADASADLVRTHAWSIDKVADATERTVDASGNATFRYTVTARAGAATESGWRLSGTVTAANPNTYDGGAVTLTGVTVTSTLGGGSSCTAPLPASPVVPAGTTGHPGTLTVPFACTFTSAPATSGTVSATVTWDPAGEAVADSVTAQDAVGFTARTETDKVVDVVDDKTVPGRRTVLETGLVWAPGLVRTYTYDLAVAGGAAGSCQTYTNTATVDLPTGADQTDTAQVRACTPLPEVAPAESSGKARGKLRATCLLTLRATMRNATDGPVRFVLKTGKKVRYFHVGEGKTRRVVTKAPARVRVVLKAQGRVLDRLRMPAYCAPPEVLPETGLRAMPFEL